MDMAEKIKTVTQSLDEYIKTLNLSEKAIKAIKDRTMDEYIIQKMREWGYWA